jgi:hypothetical protein
MGSFLTVGDSGVDQLAALQGVTLDTLGEERRLLRL